MIEVDTLVVGQMQTNCYLVSCQDYSSLPADATHQALQAGKVKPYHECLIIDPGDEAEFISTQILSQKLKPVAIVLTHGHFDHVLGCLELQLNFQVPILINQKDEKLYLAANKSAAHWQGHPGDPVPKKLQYIKDGDEIKFGPEKLVVLETPGHTPGSISLIADSRQPPAVFTGDTLFADGVGDTSHSYSSFSDLQKSLKKIKSTISNLKSNVTLYPGHGDKFNLSDQVN